MGWDRIEAAQRLIDLHDEGEYLDCEDLTPLIEVARNAIGQLNLVKAMR